MARMDRNRRILFHNEDRFDIIDIVREAERHLLKKAVRRSARRHHFRDRLRVRDARRGGIYDVARRDRRRTRDRSDHGIGAALQKTVDELQAAQKKTAEAQKKAEPPPGKDAVPAAKPGAK